MKHKPYDLQGNSKYRAFILARYRDKLSNPALQLLILGLSIAEEEHSGFCEPVIISHRKLALYALMTPPTIGKKLLELRNTGLIEYQTGERGAHSGIASTIRRYTIEELQGDKRNVLRDYAPIKARELSERLNKREAFLYAGELVKPAYKPRSTGRIYAQSPNVQSLSKKDGFNILLSDTAPGDWLIHADYKSADPTVILHTLKEKYGYKPPSGNLYDTLREITGEERGECKKLINSLAYVKDSKKRLKSFPEPAQEFLRLYAEALDTFKDDLWSRSKQGKKRFIHTLGGTRLALPSKNNQGKHTHKGGALAYYVQGTVSDIFNTAVNEMLDMENELDYAFLFPQHDAVWIRSKEDISRRIQSIMEESASKLGVSLKAEVKAEVGTCF